MSDPAFLKLLCDNCGAEYLDYELKDECWNLLGDWPEAGTPVITCLECHEKDIHRLVRADEFNGNQINYAYVRPCDCCGTIFRWKHELQWFCSIPCGKAHRWATFTECHNKYCQKRFKPKRKDQKYCSSDCSWVARHKPDLIKECPQCHDEFDADRTDQVYCGIACAKLARRAGVRTLECPICGDTFEAASRRIKYCPKADCKREGFNRTRRLNLGLPDPESPTSLDAWNNFLEQKLG